jgi:molybdopterin-containing oxidoreductase family iron-sulfur binding subunit
MGGEFAQAWGKAGFRVSFSSYLDETAAGADLVLPDLHPLEQWNDSRPRAGVYALQQPAMQPVFEGTRHTGDVVMELLARTRSPQSSVIRSFRDYLQSKWAALHQRVGLGKSFEQWWTESLQHGGVYGELPSRAARLAVGTGAAILEAVQPSPGAGIMAIVFPHPVLHDGRGANKPWLQELPIPCPK